MDNRGTQITLGTEQSQKQKTKTKTGMNPDTGVV